MRAKIVVLFLPALFGALGWASPVPRSNAYDTRRDDAKDEPKISVSLPKIVSKREINEVKDQDPPAMMWTKTGDEPDDDPLAMMYFKEADASKDEDEDDPLAMMWWKPVDDDPDTIEETES
ncbi:hypothetical protein GRF29_164g452319 [Pseudopithomyces chartarum]|uniref:Secreted protein n=1 Tax=Pseudopithomyces chartarum TaxID=1892770 RepID=A0AAN6LQT1_9PLEO|nr:hypothetical protein GRF29_164g452319 [Pseudopithomyces chartarum]